MLRDLVMLLSKSTITGRQRRRRNKERERKKMKGRYKKKGDRKGIYYRILTTVVRESREERQNPLKGLCILQGEGPLCSRLPLKTSRGQEIPGLGKSTPNGKGVSHVGRQ